MLRITVNTPSGTTNEIMAHEGAVFQTIRGAVAAQDLRTVNDPSGGDHIQYRAFCPHGTWFIVMTKETV